ncbi:nipblb [Symbiodinium necroappetens]|uniref:Nipblb protein n=1 Tax=Symbiodinium necroappetens TaxID=1628268 RepID=A0A812IXC0_9DINO|nr:nipblb [Symbiodinium necroappetens]
MDARSILVHPSIPVTETMLQQLVMTNRLGGPNCLDCTDAGDKHLRLQAKAISQAVCQVSQLQPSSSQLGSQDAMAPQAKSERPAQSSDIMAHGYFQQAEFAVDLDLTKVAGLGLEVDWADGKTLFIKSVKAEGAVPSWNKKHAANAVAAGDRIISINGKAGDPKAMLAVCKKEKQLSLLVRTGSNDAVKKVASSIASAVQNSLAALPSSEDGGKPKQSPKFFDFNVTVDMAFHSQLGLDVDCASGKSLYVRHLQAGAVEEWNRKHPAHLSVHAGDRIVAVNGFAHDAQAMVDLCRELMQSRSKFQLRVRGPPPPPAESKKDKTKDVLRENIKVDESKPDEDADDAKSSSSSSSSAEQKVKDSEIVKSKDKQREKKDKEKSKDADKAKDKDKDTNNEKDKGSKDKDRKRRDADREKDRGKDKEKAKDKNHKEKKDKDKEKDRDRSKKKARSDES